MDRLPIFLRVGRPRLSFSMSSLIGLFDEGMQRLKKDILMVVGF